MERRDPAAGVLELGRVLASARKACRSGRVEVRDAGKVHAISIDTGAISDVSLDGAQSPPGEHEADSLKSRVKDLFGLERPHVLWFPESAERGGAQKLDSASVVLEGVSKRSDLFDPRPLVDRIPVDRLRVDPARASLLRHLKLKSEEFDFLRKLTVPTPVPMILWKRGLRPERAAVLLVALNLIGLFEGEWEPGDFPRLTEALRIARRLRSACSDFELLGLGEEASSAEVDKAFRILALSLHPDRLGGFAEKEQSAAQSAYQAASAAYERIKRTRRSRPVTARGGREFSSNTLYDLAAEARRAAICGDSARARAYALKALALAPPDGVKRELFSILKLTA